MGPCGSTQWSPGWGPSASPSTWNPEAPATEERRVTATLQPPRRARRLLAHGFSPYGPRFNPPCRLSLGSTPAPPPTAVRSPSWGPGNQAAFSALPGSTWLLPVTLGVGGVLLLSVGLVVAVVAVRRVNSRRRQLKRDQDSCWTERNFPTTDMSFDNCLFTVSVWTWQPRAAKMPASPQVPGQGSTPLPLWRAASSARSGLCSDGPGGGWLPLFPLPTPVPALASTSVLLGAGSLLTRGAISGG
nr:protein HIDE1 [Pelodiscus sinensis]|eukprot:XP_025037096.1 protein HIDE1 [Pelodiscus sinensis]